MEHVLQGGRDGVMNMGICESWAVVEIGTGRTCVRVLFDIRILKYLIDGIYEHIGRLLLHAVPSNLILTNSGLRLWIKRLRE